MLRFLAALLALAPPARATTLKLVSEIEGEPGLTVPADGPKLVIQRQLSVGNSQLQYELRAELRALGHGRLAVEYALIHNSADASGNPLTEERKGSVTLKNGLKLPLIDSRGRKFWLTVTDAPFKAPGKAAPRPVATRLQFAIESGRQRGSPSAESGADGRFGARAEQSSQGGGLQAELAGRLLEDERGRTLVYTLVVNAVHADSGQHNLIIDSQLLWPGATSARLAFAKELKATVRLPR